MKTAYEKSHQNRNVLSHFFPDKLIPEKKNTMEALEFLSNHIDPLYAGQARLLQRLCQSWHDSMTMTMTGTSDRLITPYDVYSYYRKMLLNEDSDSFTVVLLNPWQQVIRDERVAYGKSPFVIQPGQVYGPAVQCQANGVICLHYCPWRENPERTEQDNRRIATLFDAGITLNMSLIDYLIVNRENFESVCNPYETYEADREGLRRLTQIAKDWGKNSLKNRKQARWHQSNDSVKHAFGGKP